MTRLPPCGSRQRESCLLRPPTAPACRTKADKFCVSTEESRCIAAARENCSRRPIREGYPRQREGTRARPRARISPRDAAPRGDYLPRLAIAELSASWACPPGAPPSARVRRGRAPRPSRARTCRCARSARDACPRRCGASPHPPCETSPQQEGKRALHRKIPVVAVMAMTFLDLSRLCETMVSYSKRQHARSGQLTAIQTHDNSACISEFRPGGLSPGQTQLSVFFFLELAKDATARRRLAPCTRPPEPRPGYHLS